MRRTLRGAEVYKFHQLNHGGRVMSIKPQLSRAVRAVSATALLGMACCPSTYAVGERSNIGAAPRYLFICAGDQARQAPDFLAVVNFNERSEGYGKIIATAPFPATADSRVRVRCWVCHSPSYQLRGHFRTGYSAVSGPAPRVAARAASFMWPHTGPSAWHPEW